jgi:hypothetical protein
MARENPKTALQRQARNTILRQALLKPQSLMIIAVALLAAIFGISFLGAPPAVWLAFGLIGELIYLTATLSDPRANAAAVNTLFTRHYDLADIKNHHARQRMEQALEYYDNIRQATRLHGGAMRAQIEATLSEVNDWVEQVYKLARRIDSFEASDLVQRDRVRVPNELNALRLRLEKETNDKVKVELRETIRLMETQLAHLQDLETHIQRADLQLDNTLAALGTIFAQIQLLDAKSVDGGRARRLRQEIQDEVSSLKDTIEAIDDVQSTTSLYAMQ